LTYLNIEYQEPVESAQDNHDEVLKSQPEPETVAEAESAENPAKPAGTRRKFLTVRRVPKNRKPIEPQPEVPDSQDFGFQKRLGELFPHSGFGSRLGQPVRESTEREERLIQPEVNDIGSVLITTHAYC